MQLDIPKYNPNDGFHHHWENGFEIQVNGNESLVNISANKEGLISLAIQLLTLAQENVSSGTHFHLDQFNSLNDGSTELIISKI
jgi:hypothetical protein